MTASMQTPVVSVIVPAYNAERVLGLQLDSLADQDGAPAYEVLVVDNNSTDGTADVVRDRIPAFPVPLRLIRAAEHQGPRVRAERRRRPCAGGPAPVRRRGRRRLPVVGAQRGPGFRFVRFLVRRSRADDG